MTVTQRLCVRHNDASYVPQISLTGICFYILVALRRQNADDHSQSMSEPGAYEFVFENT